MRICPKCGGSQIIHVKVTNGLPLKRSFSYLCHTGTIIHCFVWCDRCVDGFAEFGDSPETEYLS